MTVPLKPAAGMVALATIIGMVSLVTELPTMMARMVSSATSAGQNDCFGYQTFGTAHRNNSSDNRTPSLIARVAASVTRPLALVGGAAAPTTKLLALAT